MCRFFVVAPNAYRRVQNAYMLQSGLISMEATKTALQSSKKKCIENRIERVNPNHARYQETSFSSTTFAQLFNHQSKLTDESS